MGSPVIPEEDLKRLVGFQSDSPSCQRMREVALPHGSNTGQMSKVPQPCATWGCPACVLEMRFAHARHFLDLMAKHDGPMWWAILPLSKWCGLRQKIHRADAAYGRIVIDGGRMAIFSTLPAFDRVAESVEPLKAAELYAHTLSSATATYSRGKRCIPVCYAHQWAIGTKRWGFLAGRLWMTPGARIVRQKGAKNKPAAVAVPDWMTHDYLCDRAAKWLFSSRQCVAVSTRQIMVSEKPDAIGWTVGGVSTLVECKRSRGDFLADSVKPHRVHPQLGIGQYRYYLTPTGLISVEELPAGWGLLEVRGQHIRKVRESEQFNPSFHLERPHLVALVRYGPCVQPESLYSFG